MIHKPGIVEEELDESMFWMELLIESGIVSDERMKNLLQEADEILPVIVASWKTLRAAQNRNSKIEKHAHALA